MKKIGNILTFIALAVAASLICSCSQNGTTQLGNSSLNEYQPKDITDANSNIAETSTVDLKTADSSSEDTDISWDENNSRYIKFCLLYTSYELSYHILLKDKKQEKAFIDEIRCRNGNLTVICARAQSIKEEL